MIEEERFVEGPSAVDTLTATLSFSSQVMVETEENLPLPEGLGSRWGKSQMSKNGTMPESSVRIFLVPCSSRPLCALLHLH